MMILGNFPTQGHYSAVFDNSVSLKLQFASKPNFPLLTRIQVRYVYGKLRTGMWCDASKTKREGDFRMTEMEDEDEDDDDEVIPLANMKKWMDNKPLGFGEGKVYDTSIEDKLMEEIEQSWKPVVKLKRSPAKSISKTESSEQREGVSLVEEGFRVRLTNLPKKKNIHRDLKLAFKEVPGILDIVPVVTGNAKTRDPVCQGLAFIDFKHQDGALRFVQNYSRKSINFGKVQKQIKCEMVNSKSPEPARNINTQQSILDLDDQNNTVTELNDPLSEGQDQKEDANDSIQVEDNGETIKSQKLERKDKKGPARPRKGKIPKLNIQGSSKRLKIREKAMLAGVFSKYGPNGKNAAAE